MVREQDPCQPAVFKVSINLDDQFDSDLILDSGANITVAKNPELFEAIERDTETLVIKGTTTKMFTCEGKGRLKYPLNSLDAYFIPNFPCNLIADYTIRKHFSLHYKNKADPINDTIVAEPINGTGRKITFTRNKNKMFHTKCGEPTALMTLNDAKMIYNKDQMKHLLKVHELHKRLGYTSLERLCKMVANNVVHGHSDLGTITATDVRNYTKDLHSIICRACIRGKYTNEPASSLDNVEPTQLCDTAHIDIMTVTVGPRRIKMYYIIAIDRLSKYIMLEEVESLSVGHVLEGLSEIIKEYKANKHELKNVHMDNMATFRALRKPLRDLAIAPKYHSPERHVRRAEAAIKHIKRLFRAQILALPYACPFEFYPWAIDWAVDSSNLSLHSDNDFKTPFTKFKGEEIRFENHIRYAFGDIVETPTHENNPTTDAARTTVGIIVGREDSMRGTMIIRDLSTSQYIKRREGKPAEINKLIETQIKAIGPYNNSNIFHDTGDDREADDDNEENNDDVEEVDIEADIGLEHADDDGDIQSIDDTAESEINWQFSENESENESQNNSNENGNNDTNNDNNNSSPTEESSNNNDNETTVEKRVIEPPLSQLRRSNRPQKFNRKYFEFHPDLYDKHCLLADIDNSNSNLSNLKIKDSIKIFGADETIASIRQEIAQMFQKGVWELIDKNTFVKKVIPTKLFIKAKFNSEGNFEKLKSRIVACGNFDNDKGNKEENAAPTVNINTVMLQLAIAAKQDLELKVFDIGGAYLHAELQQDKNIRINADIVELLQLDSEKKFTRSDGSVFAKLRKCLYGLSISGKKWYETLDKFLQDCNYKKSVYDPCSYFKRENNKLAMISIYVDDILVTASSAEIDKLEAAMKRRFDEITSKSGPTISFLGMTITKLRDSININQNGYIEKISKDLNLSDNKIAPHDNNYNICNIWKDSEENSLSGNQVKSRAMQLMYVAVRSRPDILYNLSTLASLQHDSEIAIKAIDNIQSYLKHTKDVELRFRKEGDIRVSVFPDASFQCHYDLRSHSGMCIYLDQTSSPIIAKSKVQERRVDSVAEAEINAMFDALNFAKIVKGQLDELGIETMPILVNEDNQSAIKIVSNRNISFSGRAKFMNRKFLQITDAIEANEVEVKYCRSENQLADVLTKAIPVNEYGIARDNLFRIQRSEGIGCPMDDKQ